jgi:hypothetical protein
LSLVDRQPGSVAVTGAGTLQAPFIDGVPMSTKFTSGQVVRLCRSRYRTNSSGDYKIVRSLPSEGREVEYRVKGLLEPYERIVKESEIEPA